MLDTLWGPWVALLGICVSLAAGMFGLPFAARLVGFDSSRASACDIKGNISASGERIYHVPGQRYYTATRISLLRGERWFCSEAEAREAGWRRARR